MLAQDCVSALHVPPQDNSSMDGYAVRLADVAAAGVVPVSQRIAAGSAGEPLAAGTAARIFTGAPVPEGPTPSRCRRLRSPGRRRPGPGAHQCRAGCRAVDRRAGEDITQGAVVLQAGTRLSPAELGLAASIGTHQLQVARRPRVAFVLHRR